MVKKQNPNECDFFSKFKMPFNITACEQGLFFVKKQADVKKNKYAASLCELKDGYFSSIADIAPSGLYRVCADGIVYVKAPADKPKPTHYPKTTLMLAPFGKRTRSVFCELDYPVSQFEFFDDETFFFTAGVNVDADRLKKELGGIKKADKELKEEDDYHVVTELPFWQNGGGYTDRCRSRLFMWHKGSVQPLSDEFTDIGRFTLSPDRTKLLYTQCTYEGLRPLDDQLFVMDTEALISTELTPFKDVGYEGVCFMDERTVALFVNDRKDFGLNKNPDVYKFDLVSGKKKLVLKSGTDWFINSLNCDVLAARTLAERFYVDGEKVYTISTHNDSANILCIDTAAGKGNFVNDVRGLVSEAVLYEGSFYTVAYRGMAGGEIYKVDAESGDETKLSNLNGYITGKYAFSEPQDINFKNENGDVIYGFALQPHDCKPGKKYPTVLSVHGGPKTAFGPNLICEMQLLCARGYAVIFCNPTGSDGRGNEFADIRGKYGSVDYRDLMQFCDEAAKKFEFVDAGNMGIIGGSYGGYMANFVIGHTDRFKAAVSQRSIANWSSFFGTTDIGFYFAPDQVGATPWKDFDKLWENSPLKYADKVKTPTLFIHSEQDYRCYIGEGMSMYSALMYHGVPARMCVFKGENHELSRSGAPKHRIKRLTEMVNWLNKYLQK